MDPIADKLLIAAALLALVSLDRVDAWVAMVVIAREFAVSGLRIAAGQQGVVIPASGLGKVKTIVQSAAVLALIAAPDPDVRWVQAARLRDGAGHGGLGRRLLPELQAPARGALAPAGGRGGARPSALDVLGDLVQRARRPRPGEAPCSSSARSISAAVDVEQGEEQVARCRRRRRDASSASSSAAATTRSTTSPSGRRGQARLLEVVDRRAAAPRPRRAPAARAPTGRAGAGCAASSRPGPRRSARRAWRWRPARPPARRPANRGMVAVVVSRAFDLSRLIPIGGCHTLLDQPKRRPAPVSRRSAEQGAVLEPLAHRHVVRARDLPRPARARARRSGRGARPRRCGGGSSRGSPGGRAGRRRRRGRANSSTAMRDHLAHAVLDEARVHVRALDHLDLVAALHQLVDLRAHRALDDPQQRLGLDAVGRSPRGSPRAGGRCRAGCGWPRARRAASRSISSSVKPSAAQPLARALGHQLLRARAGGHAVRLDADQPARAARGGHGGAEQRVDLLRLRAGRGRRACARGSGPRS